MEEKVRRRGKVLKIKSSSGKQVMEVVVPEGKTIHRSQKNTSPENIITKDPEKYAESFSDMLRALYSYYKKAVAPKLIKDYEYKGPDLTSLRATKVNSSIRRYLSKEEVHKRKKKYKMDHMEMLLTAALRLGMQQGIYLCKDDPSNLAELEEYFAEKES